MNTPVIETEERRFLEYLQVLNLSLQHKRGKYNLEGMSKALELTGFDPETFHRQFSQGTTSILPDPTERIDGRDTYLRARFCRFAYGVSLPDQLVSFVDTFYKNLTEKDRKNYPKLRSLPRFR